MYKEFTSQKGRIFGKIVLANIFVAALALILISREGMTELPPELSFFLSAYFAVLIGIWNIVRSEKIIVGKEGIFLRQRRIPFFRARVIAISWENIELVKGQFGRFGSMVAIIPAPSHAHRKAGIPIVASLSDLKEIVGVIAQHAESAKFDWGTRRFIENNRG